MGWHKFKKSNRYIKKWWKFSSPFEKNKIISCFNKLNSDILNLSRIWKGFILNKILNSFGISTIQWIDFSYDFSFDFLSNLHIWNKFKMKNKINKITQFNNLKITSSIISREKNVFITNSNEKEYFCS